MPEKKRGSPLVPYLRRRKGKTSCGRPERKESRISGGGGGWRSRKKKKGGDKTPPPLRIRKKKEREGRKSYDFTNSTPQKIRVFCGGVFFFFFFFGGRVFWWRVVFFFFCGGERLGGAPLLLSGNSGREKRSDRVLEKKRGRTKHPAFLFFPRRAWGKKTRDFLEKRGRQHFPAHPGEEKKNRGGPGGKGGCRLLHLSGKEAKNHVVIKEGNVTYQHFPAIR